ncbi:unnamed protein product [Arctogadus glacialis]
MGAPRPEHVVVSAGHTDYPEADCKAAYSQIMISVSQQLWPHSSNTPWYHVQQKLLDLCQAEPHGSNGFLSHDSLPTLDCSSCDVQSVLQDGPPLPMSEANGKLTPELDSL